MIKRIKSEHELKCILKYYMDKYSIVGTTIPPGEYRSLEIFHIFKSHLKINLYSSHYTGDNFIRIKFGDTSCKSIIYIYFKCPDEYEFEELMEIVENIDMNQPEKDIVGRVMDIFIPKCKYMEIKYNLK